MPQPDPGCFAQRPAVQELALFHPAGELSRPGNPFGKDVANAALFRALATHGGFQWLHVLNQLDLPPERLAASFFAAGDTGDITAAVPRPRFSSALLTDASLPSRAGALLRGQPYLGELAWIRRAAGPDNAYSLVGLIHTLAPAGVREQIAAALAAPVFSWDALICTSQPVQELLAQLLARWGEQLAVRTGGQPPPLPRLPLIPLGVEVEAIAAQAADGAARAALRRRLGLADDAVLVLWVGRLSFFEKAFPQPMFQALQRAAEQLAAGQLHFAMAGWFPRGDADRDAYLEAARQLAPNVPLHLLDGNDPALLAQCWAAADIFLSLVDNIQETFGLAPVEAMAAGLPLVVSDWDGYRSTVDHGVQGFRIPSLGTGPNPQGLWLADLHRLGLETYQTYAGAVAQHTAIHVGQAADALAALARSPQLRRRLGAAGQRQARSRFSWPVVVAQIQALLAELEQERAVAGAADADLVRLHPLAGDPFADFQGFSTSCLAAERRLWLVPQRLPLPQRLAAVTLDRQYHGLRLPPAQAQQLLEQLAQAGESGCSLAELEAACPQARPGTVATTVLWLVKLGYADWRPDALGIQGCEADVA